MDSDRKRPFNVPTIKSVDVVRLVYEQFRPMTKICGPLHAGTVSIQGNDGELYLTETQYWLWSGSGGSAKELIHPEVDLLTSPQELLRNLLTSAASKLQSAEKQLTRIEQGASDVSSLLGYYLSHQAEAMTDVFATSSFFTLQNPEEWERIKKSGKR